MYIYKYTYGIQIVFMYILGDAFITFGMYLFACPQKFASCEP